MGGVDRRSLLPTGEAGRRGCVRDVFAALNVLYSMQDQVPLLNPKMLSSDEEGVCQR